ncbi:MAG: phosphoribosylglycinamide formyltransferase, partial [Alphaproteobacteria bacterium]
MKRRVAVLISGRGSNMASLLQAAKAADYPAEVVLVLSNIADAPGLAKAREAGVETAVISHRAYADRESFEAALHERLSESKVELICLAGFMRLLTAGFVDRWRDRILNIHPSLLPAFKGLHVHERALEAGVRITGCTVHIVRADMDAGPIVGQAAVPVAGDDTPATLAARILTAEHKLYPAALAALASGMVRVVGEVVHGDAPA